MDEITLLIVEDESIVAEDLRQMLTGLGYAVTGVSAGGNLKITKNLGQGTYTLSQLTTLGPVPIQSGVAPSVTISNLDAGQYLVEFGDVPYYITPPDQTNTVTLGGTTTATGTYTFIDANHNGISDAWEMDYFNSVATNRTAATDTDHDGMTDYAEFIAGTNPTNAASRFYFNGYGLQPGHRVQMQWTVATNRLYQVNVSGNLVSWTPVTPWLQASNAPVMTYTVTNSATPHFYRVQVLP